MFTQKPEGHSPKTLQWMFSMQEAEPGNFLSSLKLMLYGVFLVPGQFPLTPRIVSLLVLDISIFYVFSFILCFSVVSFL